jgi:hypothetical protein
MVNEMMFSKMSFGKTIPALILISSILTGCSEMGIGATPAPTTDPATYVAAAVATVHAQLTEQALLNPTATPTPQPTATLEPTATPIPATETPAAPAATATTAPTQAPAVSAQALYASTFPENKREYIPNERFSVAIGFKNTGSVTWEAGTKVKLVSFTGEVTVNPEVETSKAVGPGDKVEFDLWAFGSETLGQHTWNFQLYNAQGVAISGGYISFSYTSK